MGQEARLDFTHVHARSAHRKHDLTVDGESDNSGCSKSNLFLFKC